MGIRINADLLRRAAASALGGLIFFTALPAARAQWLPPWRAVMRSGDIAEQLEAQGYLPIAPLQRRPGIYLADVRAGPAGYQRLVIDDRSGEILERFMAPPRRFAPQFVARNDPFTAPPPWGGFQPPPGPPSFPGAQEPVSDGRAAPASARSAGGYETRTGAARAKAGPEDRVSSGRKRERVLRERAACA